ncbi:MAG: YdcF family protein [Gaiellales bacterium]
MTTPPTRLIVVLGFSDGSEGAALNPTCRARLETAASLATATDVVVLSGWARRSGGRSEAELMAEAWTGSARELVVDPDARSTVENLANALNDVLRVGAREVVIVTSAWHAARAKAAMRWLLLHMGIKVRTVTPADGSVRASLGELRLWPLLPFQLWHAGRKTWSI